MHRELRSIRITRMTPTLRVCLQCSPFRGCVACCV
ncbi:hypothetical protein PSPHG_CDS_0104 [Pseudomonas phage Psxphi15]